jgi:hypothetical protein
MTTLNSCLPCVSEIKASEINFDKLYVVSVAHFWKSNIFAFLVQDNKVSSSKGTKFILPKLVIHSVSADEIVVHMEYNHNNRLVDLCYVSFIHRNKQNAVRKKLNVYVNIIFLKILFFRVEGKKFYETK